PDAPDGQAMSMVARVLIQREFGRTVLPVAPACIPALMHGTEHAKGLVSGDLTLALAFDQVNQTGTLDGLQTRFREVAEGFALSNSRIAVIDPGADLFLLPAREEGSQRAGLFVL